MTHDPADGDILGAGLAFPLALRDGALALNSGEEHVRQSIRLILGTERGERPMRPEWGGALHALFAPITAATTALLQRQAREALMLAEPRIDVLDVSAQADPAAGPAVTLHIRYRIRSTDIVGNLVYPYYLNRG
jgi:uncharacterized protein